MSEKDRLQADSFNKTMTSGFGTTRETFGSVAVDPLSRTITSGINALASPKKISGYLVSSIDTKSEIARKLKNKL
jgi:hypothetical protein